MTSPDENGRTGSARRQAALPAPLRDLHRAVLRRFLDTGIAPALDWLQRAASEHGLGDAAVSDLETADLVHLDGGKVAVAYPFSGMPTRQRVVLDGYPGVYSMCAIDALGIPAMAGRDGQITATDPYDGTPVEVAVKGAANAGGGTWTWSPAEAVVVYGRLRDCGTHCESREALCPHTTFHASHDSARAYLAAHADIDGQILDQNTAIERGRLSFGTLLTGPA